MILRRTVALSLLLLSLAACGGGGSTTADPTGPADPSTTSEPSATTTTQDAPSAAAEILGEATSFSVSAGEAGDLDATIEGRECVLADELYGSCRAATGAGGAFVVTTEGVLDASDVWTGEWNIVVRCGLAPARPAGSATGTFGPRTADLGLAPYGDVIGVTLVGESSAEAALVYLPEGAECPVVWSLGEVDPNMLFTGGTDALNGEESPIFFSDGAGADACAVADDQGGIKVGSPKGDRCA